MRGIRRAANYAEKLMAANGIDMSDAAESAAKKFNVTYDKVVRGLERDLGKVTISKYDQISDKKMRESVDKRFKRLIKRMIHEEISKSKLNEAINLPKEFTVDMELGKMFKRAMDIMVNELMKKVGKQADLKFTTEPRLLRGASYASLRGYSKSDIEIDVDITIYGPINNENTIEVKVEDPRMKKAGVPTKEKFKFSISENPSDKLESAMTYIVNRFGYNI